MKSNEVAKESLNELFTREVGERVVKQLLQDVLRLSPKTVTLTSYPPRHFSEGRTVNIQFVVPQSLADKTRSSIVSAISGAYDIRENIKGIYTVSMDVSKYRELADVDRRREDITAILEAGKEFCDNDEQRSILAQEALDVLPNDSHAKKVKNDGK